MTVRLSLRVAAPETGESLLGFFHRLADRNGFAGAGALLPLLGHSYGHALLESLASLESGLGMAPGTLATHAPSAHSSDPVLERRFERLHANPICPACIEEDRVHAAAWRHCFVTACPIHGILLTDTCPRCRGTLSSRFGGWRTCACSHPLSEFPHVESGRLANAASALLAGVGHPDRALLPAPLHAETPLDIGRFFFFLCSHARPTLAGKAEKTRLPRNAAESQDFVASGLDLLLDWPDAFDEHVRRRLEDGDPAAPTAPERLGRWYNRMTRFRSEASRPFHDRLAAIIAAEFDGSFKGSAFGPDRFPAAWMSAASAARELGVRADRIVAAVANGALNGRTHRSGLGHRHYVIARSAVVEVRRNRERYIDSSSAAKLLGISSRQLKLLVDAGVVLRVAERPVLADGSIDRMALQEAVDDLRARTSVREGAKLPFKEINLRRTTDRSALLELYRRIFRGDVVLAAWSEARTLGDFEFLRVDVDEALAELRRGEGWTVQQLATITGWKQACISAWCGQGLMQARPARYGRLSGYIISPENLSAFQSAFVPVATLARSSGRSSRGVLKQLGHRGIRTFGAFRDGPAERGHLVRVSDLLAASS